MPIQALALLQVPGLEPVPGSSLRIQRLEDAVLLHTGESFATDPAELATRVRALIGDSVADRHSDPRGIFYVPDVAAPKARSYAAVIAEVGEGGVWGPLRTPSAVLPESLKADDLAAFLNQVPSSLIDAVGEVTRRDPDALRNASKQLEQMMGESGAQGIGQLLGSAGIDLSGGGLAQLVSSMQQELAANPDRLAELAEQLLGGAPLAEDDSDESDSDESHPEADPHAPKR